MVSLRCYLNAKGRGFEPHLGQPYQAHDFLFAIFIASRPRLHGILVKVADFVCVDGELDTAILQRASAWLGGERQGIKSSKPVLA